MKVASKKSERGFSLIEVLAAILVTMIVMASVFLLLLQGQKSFRREPEVADMTANARAGLDRISRDLLQAGYKTPPAYAVLWKDGGGLTPDELTIVYGDPDVPTSKPICSAGNPNNQKTGQGCGSLAGSSTLWIDPATMDPRLADPTYAYHEGQVLFAFETADCNNDGEWGMIPFNLTKPPRMSGGQLHLQHNPQGALNSPAGFNREIEQGCAIIGAFRVIQYRVSPLPPTPNPLLERRDLGTGTDQPWTAVANNIENLQVQYSVGSDDNFVDVPANPDGNDPATWIKSVRVTVSGRSESTNLEGASQGVFAPEDTQLRRTFTTAVSLRNQVMMAQQRVIELELPAGWN